MHTQSLLHVENTFVCTHCDCNTQASDTVGVCVCMLQWACSQFCFIYVHVVCKRKE